MVELKSEHCLVILYVTSIHIFYQSTLISARRYLHPFFLSSSFSGYFFFYHTKENKAFLKWRDADPSRRLQGLTMLQCQYNVSHDQNIVWFQNKTKSCVYIQLPSSPTFFSGPFHSTCKLFTFEVLMMGIW